MNVEKYKNQYKKYVNFINKYRKKPVEIEAVQFNGWNFEEIHAWMLDLKCVDSSYFRETMIIKTLEGDMTANIGDYIIKGVRGEFYPCKPDIFELTYEKQTTLEEVQKEWEALRYEWKENEDLINICVKYPQYRCNKIIYIHKKEKSYGAFEETSTIGEPTYQVEITFQEHELITKTLKALPKEEKYD